jgi:hypothetical protein
LKHLVYLKRVSDQNGKILPTEQEENLHAGSGYDIVIRISVKIRVLMQIRLEDILRTGKAWDCLALKKAG